MSKFTEDFSEDGPHPVPRKSKFTEHFDISMTDEDMLAMCNAAPCQSAYQETSKSVGTKPINKADPTPVLGPSTSPSASAVQPAYRSSMSVYSRESTDPKPFIPIDGSSESSRSISPGQLKIFFVFHDGDDICDTRHLFGDAAVDANIQINTLKVLTGKGSAKAVRDINRFRSTLPRSSPAKAASTHAHNSSTHEGEIEAFWMNSQRTWRKHAKAILEKERVAIINGYIDDAAGESNATEEIGSAGVGLVEEHQERSYGTNQEGSESTLGLWDEVEAQDTESLIMEFEIGKQGWRGRSPTAKQATAASQ